jgi:hypothetical protein
MQVGVLFSHVSDGRELDIASDIRYTAGLLVNLVCNLPPSGHVMDIN